jgi:CRP-like cAMP-binding protein
VLGEFSTSLYVILAGKVKITKQQGELAEVELRTAGPREYFGEFALFDGEARSATVRTLTACEFFILEREAFLEMLARSPDSLSSVLADLTRSLRATSDRVLKETLAHQAIRTEMEVARYRSLAQMVAGVAHEINTPLGIVNTAASIVKERVSSDALGSLATDGRTQGILEDIKQATVLMEANITRAHGLIQDFKKLSVGQMTDMKETVDIVGVMESDQAGLELCRHIRETMGNKLTQIYIRTGQPGVAPEREVMDRFDINGYYSKVETTEDKLYSLVKAGVRQFDFASMALLEFEVVTRAISASDSLEHLRRVMYGVLTQVPLNAQGNPSNADTFNPRVSLLIGDQLLAGTIPEAESIAIRDRLLTLGLKPLTPNGDGYATDGKEHLVKVAATDAYDEASHIAQLPAMLSMGDTLVLLNFTKSIAALAKRAAAATRETVPAG